MCTGITSQATTLPSNGSRNSFDSEVSGAYNGPQEVRITETHTYTTVLPVTASDEIGGTASYDRYAPNRYAPNRFS